jgi:hypothetical protein
VSDRDPAMGFDFYNLIPGGVALEHWINSDSEAAYAHLRGRWDKLLAWDPERKAPQTIPMVRSWRAFSEKWESLGAAFEGKDRDGLREQALNLQTAEGNAQLRGYSNPPDVPALTPAEQRNQGAPMTPPLVHAPGPEELHPITKAVDDAAKKAGLPAPSPADPPPADPLLVPKALGVGAMVLGTIVAAATAKKDSARVGIAVGGLVVSGLAGWLAFRPDDAPPKKGA